MTDEQAWRRIAAAFEEALETGVWSEATRNGLCWALDVVRGEDSEYDTMAHRALNSITDGVGLGESYDHDAARLRATVALLMAELAADDGGNHKEADS